jgi:uncharacterized protein with HEPN domain
VQPTLADRIGHIASAIDNIRRILAGYTRESFASDLVIRLAVERLFEIISEASRFIPPELKAESRTSIGEVWPTSGTGCATPIIGPMRICCGT